jgi:hypothetical protein
MQKNQKDVNEDAKDQSEEVDGEQHHDENDKDEPATKRHEDRGNLRRRSNWFQKRHGGG